MKKIIILSTILACFNLSAVSIECNNSMLQTATNEDYSTLFQDDDSYFSDQVGSPAIPLKTYFWEIPADKKIVNVQIRYDEIDQIRLEKTLQPIPQAQPLSFSNLQSVTVTEPEYYDRDIYPAELLYRFGSGFSGNRKIAYISYYTAFYHPRNNLLQIPRQIRIDYDLQDADLENALPAGYSSERIAEKLNISAGNRNEAIKYLLIYPEQFADSYEELLNWRKIQGLQTFGETIENIELDFEGSDLQEKLRNFIIEMYETEAISFVTLGADCEMIPDRKAFAFDCEYGAYPDENDLPCDMYYSCLNGDWNADEDDVYGENEDDVDFFPELFISRIPAASNEEVQSYVNSLIDYESGIYENYKKAGGFSMALWDGSDSQVCQQYIYENYFPDEYDISFLYGSENTTENAYNIINSNQNLIQHTGHAGTEVMALQDGYIRNSNLELLDNQFGGIFYSIGCWSAAMDYDSIGENLVKAIDEGMLGFAGNSRYGWGAPSASGFGFSEFYQKEFFKNIFRNEIKTLSELNAMQKIPFIPYFCGTSVYKWVAYELNALGDSYFQLFQKNPKIMEANIVITDSIYIQAAAEDLPLSDVIVSFAEQQVKTDFNGNAALEVTGGEAEIYLYKSGYRTINRSSSEITNIPYIENTLLPEYCRQAESFTINSIFHNPTFQEFDFSVVYEYDEAELELTSFTNPAHILDFASVELSPLEIYIYSIAEYYQMQNGENITLVQKIIDTESDTLIACNHVSLRIQAPQLDIIRISFDSDLITAGSDIPFEFTVKNNGMLDAAGLSCEFITNNEYFSFSADAFALNLHLPPGADEIISNTIHISEAIPGDYICDLNIDLGTSSQDQNYGFAHNFLLPVGNIGFSDSFEEEIIWNCPAEWQQVNTFAYDGEFSFSCRPAEIGTYTAHSPNFAYLPETNFSFQYKYKMPMYGEDGVYFILNYENNADTLLFLGAGGALTNPEDERPNPFTYIENDWAFFSLDLAETIIDPLEIGTIFSLELKFKFAEEIEDFNQYAAIPEIGVFIDDFQVCADEADSEISINDIQATQLKIFPNPVFADRNTKFQFSLSQKCYVSAEVYNIKGQKVKRLFKEQLADGQHLIYWNGKDQNNLNAASGLYFFKLETGEEQSIKKFILSR